MHRTEQENELLSLEKRYWQAMKDRDVEAALQLTDFPCIVAGPEGFMKVEEPAFREMMTARKDQIDRIELGEDAQVRLIRDDVAIVAYQLHSEKTVDGKAVVTDATDSSTWIRRDGQWKCAQHTEAPREPAPDRKPEDPKPFD